MSPVTTFPSSESAPLSAWATAYAERGFPVFPLVARDKRPLTSNGFKAATTDHDVIAAWWTRWPDANIGIATGHAFDVLDVDGLTGVKALNDHLGYKYQHPGPLVLTGRGWHLLFQPTGRGNGAALLGPDSKIDFRGIGGYVVAPPSIHPLGHRYSWGREANLTLPQGPQWLTNLLDKTTAVASTPTARQTVLPNHILEALKESGVLKTDLPNGVVRDRLGREDILQVCADKGLTLRRRGRYYVTNCVFHKDDTPSMGVYPDNNTFYCYGCTAHGDSYDLRHDKHI